MYVCNFVCMHAVLCALEFCAHDGFLHSAPADVDVFTASLVCAAELAVTTELAL